ncbi:SGNH/GDSL hydrolase family protein [Nonomuraea fuscirosea]
MVEDRRYGDGQLPGPEELVDGSHPSDLGMMTYANAYEKVLRPILNRRGH